MKPIFAAITALAALASPALASAKAPIEGQWKNGPMIIEIAPCGPKLCGTVVKASAIQQGKAMRGSGTKLVGSRLITDIEPTGTGTYRGHVFAADRNIHASGTLRQVSANEIEVKGCILGLFCKSRTYERVR
jgi:uncharacterized protein (DUF2147 family)